MKLFELAWIWYEEYCPYLFIHPDKTEEQFNADVKDAFKKFGDDYLKQEDSWAGAERWTAYVASRLHEYGYTEVLPIRVSCCGRKCDSDDRTFAEKFIGEDLFKKAIEHNKKIKADCES
jgi:hypothetical protein